MKLDDLMLGKKRGYSKRGKIDQSEGEKENGLGRGWEGGI